MITEFKVGGMHCNSCVALIKMSVNELEGITDVSGDQGKGFIRVSFDESQAKVKEIVKKIEQEGYKVTGYNTGR